MKRISHGSSGVWAVDNAGKIYTWNNEWQQVAGRLVHISSGKQVWGVNSHDDIYRYNGNNKWTHIGGKLINVRLYFRDLFLKYPCLLLERVPKWYQHRGTDISKLTGVTLHLTQHP